MSQNHKCGNCKRYRYELVDISTVLVYGGEPQKKSICLDCLAEKLEFRIEQIRELKRDQVKECFGGSRFF